MTIQRMDTSSWSSTTLRPSSRSSSNSAWSWRGRAPLEGRWAGRVIGLDDVRQLD
ncbi:hypothetical protein ACFVGN_06810 [Streptomyces sp. NPDC057757]|uniref:hypothetical protein n=1 Tax=Streptomyces sp. NPDC057757 TaxID=3346241 RepID=UPI0036AD6E51